MGQRFHEQTIFYFLALLHVLRYYLLYLFWLWRISFTRAGLLFLRRDPPLLFSRVLLKKITLFDRIHLSIRTLNGWWLMKSSISRSVLRSLSRNLVTRLWGVSGMAHLWWSLKSQDVFLAYPVNRAGSHELILMVTREKGVWSFWSNWGFWKSHRLFFYIPLRSFFLGGLRTSIENLKVNRPIQKALKVIEHIFWIL